MIVVVRAVFYENYKYFPQVFFDEQIMNNVKMLYYDKIDVIKRV